MFKEIDHLPLDLLSNLVERIPHCFEKHPLSRRARVTLLVSKVRGLVTSAKDDLAVAEHWEHIAGIDQTDSDDEHAAMRRNEAHESAGRALRELNIGLARLMGSIRSQSVAKLTEVAIEAEYGNVRSRGRASMVDSDGLVLSSHIIVPLGQRADGVLIRVLSPWKAIVDECLEKPEFLYYFSQHPRRFEEFVAATYDRAGWEEVILTPASADGGRDIIATRSDVGPIRILEQTKAYRKGHFVTHDSVRSMLGTLLADPNASKGIITTTSDFQPGVYTSQQIQQFVPHRLELKNGESFLRWLEAITASFT